MKALAPVPYLAMQRVSILTAKAPYALHGM
jgi:hypothetical protein